MSPNGMNVLLHACCASCSIYPIDQLKKIDHRIAVYFYNPNIQPYSEYLKRRTEAEKYSKESGLNMIAGDYDIEKYFRYILKFRKIMDTNLSMEKAYPLNIETSVTDNETPENRCPLCWWMRLERTARFAKENGFEAFTTTLLGSPYQDHDTIKNIAGDVANKAGLKFYYEDFRAGFKESIERAKSKGIYCQNYCGCLFSEKERLERKMAAKPRGKKI